jgi:pectin methylesterase-like acyl-CoA thioesterase/lysophospholipase L1-like esterase
MAAGTGYGDALCGLFRWQVRCVNFARGGRSTKSYRVDGSWRRVQDALEVRGRPTFVLIQLGHNDQPGKAERETDLAREFPANLGRYVDEVSAAGAQPVLVTPLTRRGFKEGVLDDTLAPWAAAVREVAAQRGVPLLDLHADSMAAVSKMGTAKADELAQAPAPDKAFDHTHVGPRGAALFARMVAVEIQRSVPALASHLAVGAVEPPGRIARPQLDDEAAREYSYRAVLGDWDPASEGFPTGMPDFVVDVLAPAGPAGLTTIQAAVDAAVASGMSEARILVRPGIYEGAVDVPAAPVRITLEGDGRDPSAVVIRAAPTGVGFPVVRVANRGFRAQRLTIENSHNKAQGDRTDQVQAVALMLDDADRAHLADVRLLGFQDTLHLAAGSPARPARAFLDRVYVEGDMDFIFGEATAYFRESEIHSLGDRAISYTLAPSTHYLSRHGFVFSRCRFTHDGTPNARAGVFKLARQWNRGAWAVGKVAILESSIGAHIDAARPWADWSIGTPRYRPVQYDADEYWERLIAAGIDPARDLGYPPRRRPVEPFLAEYHNTQDPGGPP